MLCAGFLALLAGCSPPSSAPTATATPPPLPPANPEIAALGAKVYTESCANCHQDGAGNRGMPALRGSAVVSGPAAGLIEVVLKGQRGKSLVNGQKLNSTMPATDYLTDEEAAAVVMHVRRKFANVGDEVSRADVKKQR